MTYADIRLAATLIPMSIIYIPPDIDNTDQELETAKQQCIDAITELLSIPIVSSPCPFAVCKCVNH
jgi:hypothetical protein